MSVDPARLAGRGTRPQTALVLNKVDRVEPKERLLPRSARLHGAFRFDWPPFMISARTGDGVHHLRDWLLLAARPGAWVAPEGLVHAQTPLVIASEIIREQLFSFFSQEIPYLLEQRNLGWCVELSETSRSARPPELPRPWNRVRVYAWLWATPRPRALRSSGGGCGVASCMGWRAAPGWWLRPRAAGCIAGHLVGC